MNAKILLKEYPEFNLYEYEKGIYLIELNSAADAMYLLRLQETYDHPIYKNKYFDILEYIEEYIKGYGKGVFSYTLDFCGFNINNSVFKLVYSFNFIKNKYDIRMYEIYTLIQERIGNKKFCVLGYKKGDGPTFLHELHHAYFYLNTEYRKEMKALVKELQVFYPERWEFIKKDLANSLYDEKTFIDEAAAYLCSGPTNWKVDKILVSKFKKLFKKYYNGESNEK